MNERHPSGDLIAQYALGHASPGGALAVAAHLTYCPTCRAKAAAVETFSATLAPAEAAPVPDFDALRLRLTEETGQGAAPSHESTKRPNPGPLPAPVSEAVGCDFERIPWRFRLPGVHEYVLSDEGGEKISLLRVRPGAGVPQHTHDDEELTVIFDGELMDGDKRYGVGDVAHADPSVDHHPRAGGDRPCICLTVVGGSGVTFTGRFGRALNLFT